MGFLLVFLGGGIGAALRHGVNLAGARVLGSGFNYATMFENVSGSLAYWSAISPSKARSRSTGGCF